jgi:hypothetical protein
MSPTYLTTIVGLAGVALGSLTSFSTTWWTQRVKLREDHAKAALNHRKRLFGDFIHEASRLYADALCSERDDVAGLVRLYALLAEMRLLPCTTVIGSAQQVMSTIIDTYLSPNLTLHELHEMAQEGRFDFLRDFSAKCAAELAHWDNK